MNARCTLAVVVLLAMGLLAAPARATNVCGTIATNTSWTFINSPYVLTCDVVIIDGATLTIDPGVVVQFGPNTRLKAQTGMINAVGTAGSHISFTSNSDPTGFGIEIVYGSSGDGIFTYCDFSSLDTGILKGCCNSAVAGPITNCTFTGCVYGLSSYTGPQHQQVTDCTFSTNVYGVFYSAYTDFTGCVFQNSGVVGADAPGQCTFTLCTFINNPTGVQSSPGQGVTLDRCGVVNNTVVGAKACDLIRRCTITSNATGIQIQGSCTIECSDIYSNTTYNAEMITNTTVSAPNNWWGTTSTASIDAGIRDGFDQSGLGFLTYAPFLPGLEATTSTCACSAPVITSQPGPFAKNNGETATFAIVATATGTPTYTWKRDGIALQNTGRISGVNTNTLVINPVARSGSESNWTDTGVYTCDVINLCGTATSSCFFTANWCKADANESGTVTVGDIFDFLNYWFAGCP